ncbi:streptophobe family protein [Streptomyces sp. NPDC093252]|uniref:streptophobe family protein n=1 Tax=Streptomyces sp. NPDC093252 TaxID=3154980 RepID=UPI00341A20EE
MGVETVRRARPVPWIDVLLSAVAAVSWALIAMTGTAALGLHLLEADAAGSLGPMAPAVVALGAGGSVSPSGDVSAFGLEGAEASTAIEITPLGVSLVGALLLSWVFLRSLRSASPVPPGLPASPAPPAPHAWSPSSVSSVSAVSSASSARAPWGGVSVGELLARVGSVVVLFEAALGGLAWAGHDVITIDGGALGLEGVPGGGGGGGDGGGVGGIEIPGLGDVGDIGGLLPDRVGDLIDAQAAVGFTVDTVPTLLGGLCWVLGVLLIALLASRRTPLPRGLAFVHRVVRPAVSSLVAVLLVAVAAGLAAAGYAAIGDEHPRRIVGAALLGAPNGVWLGVPIGLFVPYEGDATGPLVQFLPDPLDDLLAESDGPVTLGRLAELDGRVWLLAVGVGVLMLLAGVWTGVRTPVGRVVRFGGGGSGGGGGGALLGFVWRCAVPLGVATAVALPVLGWLAGVSVNASLSVLGVDAFGAGIELRGHLGAGMALGAVWGVGAGVLGALLAWGTGAAGRQAVGMDGEVVGVGSGAGVALGDVRGVAEGSGAGAYAPGVGPYASGSAERAGPYAPGVPYRPPSAATNPYLRRVGDGRGEGARLGSEGRGEGREPGRSGWPGGAGRVDAEPFVAPSDGPADGAGSAYRAGGSVDGAEGVVDGVERSSGGVHGAPTEAAPAVPPAPPLPRWPPTSPEDGPPPPPGRPNGRR